MRSDKPKAQSTQKPGRKRERREPESVRGSQGASRRDDDHEGGERPVRRRDEKSGQTLH